jgi:glycosyltransferase involved in cell wall biosynthesis
VLHEVLNEKNAAFYPPEDLAALTEKFAELQKNDLLRQSLGRQARLDVVKYSWDKRMKTILNFFDHA